MAPPVEIALLDGAFYAGDAAVAYRWLRANAPVWRDRSSGIYAIASYDAVRAAEVDPARFSNAGGSRPASFPLPFMIDMDDPLHRKHRRLVSRGFTPRRVAAHEGRVRQICDDLIDAVAERGHCDLVADLAAPLPLIVIGDQLGVEVDDRDDLLRWSDAMVASQTSGADVDAAALAEAATTAFTEYHAYATAVIAERRRAPTGDLVSVLVEAEIDGERLSDDEIVYETLLILIGGDETTRHVIGGGVEALLHDREAWEALQADRDALPLAVEELLRFVSPIKTMARTVTVPGPFFGAELDAGDQAVLLYESANFDEARFDRPERLDVRRAPNDHLAFGLGTHHCLGASLARLEIRLMLERLLERLPDLELAGDGPAQRRPNSFVSGPEAVPVRFGPVAALRA